MKRVNVYRFPTYNFKKENDNISFNDDRVADNRRPYKDNQNIEPQSVRLTPKPKFVNSKPVTFFAWQLFQVRTTIS